MQQRCRLQRVLAAFIGRLLHSEGGLQDVFRGCASFHCAGGQGQEECRCSRNATRATSCVDVAALAQSAAAALALAAAAGAAAAAALALAAAAGAAAAAAAAAFAQPAAALADARTDA